MNAYPLVSGRSLDDVIAWRPDGPVTVGQFLQHVHAVADWLPTGHWVINLCEDRYHFAVLFGACAISGRVSLQPSSQAAETLQRLCAVHEGAYAVVDGEEAAAPAAGAYALPSLDQGPVRQPAAIPEIPGERTVAILFTSGSTGQPQPHAKTWAKLVANGQAEAAALGLTAKPHVLVGTVPAQHSYGFESTFLLALHGGCSFWGGKPFFPQDLADALAAVPRPRMVVTTPFHMGSVIASDARLPAIDTWLSATAPLSTELAAKVESVTDAPVYEIYGSTESSQLATRRTCDGPAWALMPGVELEQAGDTTWALGDHVEGRVALADVIGLLADRRFELRGRHADMVNLAGKRTSLAYLNHQLCSIQGVADGAFYLPHEDRDDCVGRLVAFVVAPALDAESLRAALRLRIDPVFMPRPIVMVDALPRNSTGKLARDTLQQLFDGSTTRNSDHAA